MRNIWPNEEYEENEEERKSRKERLDLFREEIERLRPLQLDISRKDFDYLNSFTIASATIASFSLIGLQINSNLLQVNPSLLILGFSILLINTFISIFITRLGLINESRSVESRAKLIQYAYEVNKILDLDPGLENSHNKETYESLVKEIDAMDFINEAKSINFWSKVIDRVPYITLSLLFIGIILLICSVGNVIEPLLTFIVITTIKISPWILGIGLFLYYLIILMNL